MTENTINKIKFPYRYDIVGSFLRPEKLKQARADLKTKKITQKDLTKVEDQEIKRLVNKEVELGLKDVTDGEFRRSWWHFDFLAGLNGVHFIKTKEGYEFHNQETRREGLEINNKIAYNPNHPFFSAFKYLKQITPNTVTVKQTIPSPAMLFPGEDTGIYNNYYTDFDSFLADEIKAYQKTVQHFYDLGVRYLQ